MDDWLEKQISTSFRRLRPRLEAKLAPGMNEAQWVSYISRVEKHFPALFDPLYKLYGHHYDFFFHLESILTTATEMWQARPDELKALDAARCSDPNWFQSNNMVGASCYVDCFGGNLSELKTKIFYLKELGITYLHLMPLFLTPPGDSDGGYAVSSYREVNPELGTMAELIDLARELRDHGISLCLDFVFNHTADDHQWAKSVLAGQQEFQDFYRMFPDRELPDKYEENIPEIFPDEHSGCFTYRSKIGKWVWTTFHNYQWDLNYENPIVFNKMAEEMLFLANIGVEVLRLDAVAFLWKQLGTTCQNLPQAHLIIQAFNAVAKMAAPAVVFKSEAIVHPDEVAKYVADKECPLSYNPQLMALLWEALATRDVKLLRTALKKRFSIPSGCAWVNYVRCHDDIGWAFSNDDAVEVGIEPKDHRRFLMDFYTGRFKGSFARGLPFQENLETGDARVSGSCASLVGVEQALAEGGQPADGKAEDLELAIQRLLLLYGVTFTIGGIPLIYLGDELGYTNDYTFHQDPEKAGDSRWVHRPWFDWTRAKLRKSEGSIEGKVYHGMLRLIRTRQRALAFTGSQTEFLDTGNDCVLGYFRNYGEQTLLVLANFSEKPQPIEAKRLRLFGLRKTVTDLVSGQVHIATDELVLGSYQLMVVLGVS